MNQSNEYHYQKELQHLITFSTGFMDAYVIHCYGKDPILLPQNIILSAMDSPTKVQTVEWHETALPVFAVHHPERTLGVALVIEGDSIEQRFVLMCDEMPKTIRLRISELVDDERERKDPTVFQYVKVGTQIFQIPHLDYIQQNIQQNIQQSIR